MQKISRAGDSIWVSSAFDPRKPFDPDWAEKEPKPVLRSGDESDIFDDGPEEHHQGGDSMEWTPESHGAEEFNLDDYEEHPVAVEPTNREVPGHDLLAIGNHGRELRSSGVGRLEGNDPRGPMVQYNSDSNTNHYYTYNPHDNDGGKPWHLSTTHWNFYSPITSRHPDFESAATQASKDKEYLRTRHGIG